MTIKQSFKSAFLHLTLVLLGIYIFLEVWWAKNGLQLLAIIAFALIGFGSLFLALALSRIIIPAPVNYGYSVLSSQEQYNAFKRQVGAGKVRAITVLYVSLTFIFFAVSALYILNAVQRIETYQLNTFGIIQTVRINAVKRKTNGLPFAYFDYHLNGKIFTTNLPAKYFTGGDSCTIIFSSKKPDIVEWLEDFNNPAQ